MYYWKAEIQKGNELSFEIYRKSKFHAIHS